MVSRARVKEAAIAALKAERVKDAMLSITFVGRAAMSELNRRYLGHRGPTDVISFGLGRTGETRRGDRGHLHLSGDRPRQREAAGRAARGGDPETCRSRYAARPRARPSDRSVAHHFRNVAATGEDSRPCPLTA